MKKILSFLALACSSVYAQYYDLNCVAGVSVCGDSPCFTIIFDNKSPGEVGVNGVLEASLSGAARFLDSKFEFAHDFKHGKTSCFVPTGGFGRITKSVKVVIKTDKGSCDIFLPKSAVSSSNTYHTILEADGNCVITH